MSNPRPVGFVVDLDDTVYPQSDYLAAASAAVGRRSTELGQDGVVIERSLAAVLRHGSDRGFTINEALDRCGVAPETQLVAQLVEAFVECRPDHLECYSGVKDGLRALRERGALACLTDGRPEIQRAKLTALGLSDAFDLIVITDELGGRRVRKPNPTGLVRIANEFKLSMTKLVVIGDRPDKDVTVARDCGARAVRIKQGEYAALPALGGETTVSNFREAVDAALALELEIREGIANESALVSPPSSRGSVRRP